MKALVQTQNVIANVCGFLMAALILSGCLGTPILLLIILCLHVFGGEG